MAEWLRSQSAKLSFAGSNPAPISNDERRNSSLTYWYNKNIHPKAG